MLEFAFFCCVSVVLLTGAIGVIGARNPVHSALFLVLTFVSSAAIWLLLEAEFLAMTLILVYVGAVMVLFLFVVMMLDINVATMRAGFVRYAPLGFAVAVVAVAELLGVIWVRNEGLPVDQAVSPKPADYSNTRELGEILYTQHVYAFELAAFILLLAIVAAIVLTMRRRPGLKMQDINAQVSVRASERVQLVSMEAEKD